jgi:beta-lactam-binding protein with PASTA domain
MTIGEAYEELESENGFKMAYNPNWSSEYKVTIQNPAGGEMLRRGRSVEVASMVRVPDVTGLSVDLAKEELTRSKLEALIPEYFEDDDQVLRQSMRSGKMVPALSQIRLTTGVQVPNLIGLNEAEADRELRRSAINGSPVFKQIATTDPRMHGQAFVDQQSIRAGEYITRTTGLRVVVVKYIYQAPAQPIFEEPRPPTRRKPIGDGGGGGGGMDGGGGMF